MTDRIPLIERYKRKRNFALHIFVSKETVALKQAHAFTLAAAGINLEHVANKIRVAIPKVYAKEISEEEVYILQKETNRYMQELTQYQFDLRIGFEPMAVDGSSSLGGRNLCLISSEGDENKLIPINDKVSFQALIGISIGKATSFLEEKNKKMRGECKNAFWNVMA